MRLRLRAAVPSATFVVCLVGLLAGGGWGQVATAAPPTVALAKANPQVSREVVASLPKWLQDRGDIYIDSSITSRTPLLFTDGSVVSGQSGMKAAAAARCGAKMSAGTLLGWMPAADSNCGYIGITEDATITYSVYSDSETHGTAQFKALGYETKQKCTIKIPFKPKCTTVNVAVWNQAGTGNGRRTFHWGKVASVPSMKAKAVSIGAGWAGGYVH